MIIRTPTGRIFDGDYEVIKNNSGEGYVTGTEITGSYVISENSNVYVMASYLRGRVKTYPFSSPEQVEEPIDRMMPLMISLGYLWSGSSYRKPEFEITSRYAAKQDDLSTRDSNDTSRIPPGGTPEYLVLDLRYGFMLTDNLKINLVADNLLNKDYRVHGSGTNMPGRNFIVNMSLNF